MIGMVLGFVIRLFSVSVMLAFWTVFGLVAWLRMIVFAIVAFTGQAMLAPFSRDAGRAGQRAQQQFNLVLGWWENGFRSILAFLRGPALPDLSLEDEPEADLKRAVAGFVWQILLVVSFYAPILALAYGAGWVRIDALDARLGVVRHVTTSPAEVWDLKPATGVTSLTALPTTAPSFVEFDPQTFRTIEPVNLRLGPGAEYLKAGKLESGVSILVNGTTQDGKWSRVERGSKPAVFVSTRYLRAVTE